MENAPSSNGLKEYPKLRFPGFDEPCMECRIGNIYSGRSQRGADDMELLSATLSDGVMPRSEIKGKDNSSEDKSNYKAICKGDTVYDSVCVWQGANDTPDHDGIVSPAYTVLIPSKEIDNRYFVSLFKTPNLINGFRKYSQGLTPDTWNPKCPQIRSIRLYIPSLQEQRKIFVFISTLEERVSTQRQLVDSLRKYKRGLLHEILCEKIRITESVWNVHKIGGYLNSENIKQFPAPDAPLMAFMATGGVCDKGECYDRDSLVRDVNTKLYKRTDLGDFMCSSNNLDVGSVGLNLYGSAVISGVYEIFSISGTDPWFINEAVQQKSVLHQMLKYRQGCLCEQYRVYAEDFLEVSIRVPPLETQKQISTIFSGVEYKIKGE